jgi:hypothetical protein
MAPEMRQSLTSEVTHTLVFMRLHQTQRKQHEWIHGPAFNECSSILGETEIQETSGAFYQCPLVPIQSASLLRSGKKLSNSGQRS